MTTSSEVKPKEYIWPVNIRHHHGEEDIPFALPEDSFEFLNDNTVRINDTGNIRLREAMVNLTAHGYFKPTDLEYIYIPASSIVHITWPRLKEKEDVDENTD